MTLYLLFNSKLIKNRNLISWKGDFINMGLTEIFVMGFLAILGFLAFINSRKVSRELNKLNTNK